MNRKNGNYVVPDEIQALAPKGIPCQIEAQYYQPKKKGIPIGCVRIYYYVYEQRTNNSSSEVSGKPYGRLLLGKITGGKFVANEKGAKRINEILKNSDQNDKEEINYIPKLRSIDPEIKNYGEYAVILASTKDVLSGIERFFNTEDATRMYVLAIIYFVKEYTPASYCGDIFKQSILSDKWKTLSFGEDTINTFLKDIGRAGLECELYSQNLINQSSGLTALDGHVIVSSSQENELAEYGYKYYELKSKQINIMGAYDAENKRQLISWAMSGNLPDKISVKEVFKAYIFNGTTFLADAGFYSEDDIGEFRKNGNHFIVCVPDTCILAKEIKSDPFFTESFVYEHVDGNGTKTMRSILYKECTVSELEALNDARREKETAVKNEQASAECKGNEKPKKFYTRYCNKSKWGSDRVILYRDQVMHDKLVYDYRMQIGIDDNHTEEKLKELEPGFGLIVLRTDLSKDKFDASSIYLKYKKRWTIETHYDFVANTVKFEGLQTDDYYSMQGLSFMILLVGQIKADYMNKLRGSQFKSVKNMSLKESLTKAAYVKFSLHQDNKWHSSEMVKSTAKLFETMGVSVEDDKEKLNLGTF